MSNENKEMDILCRNKKEMLEIKHIKMEIKNALDGLITGLDTYEQRIFELEVIDISVASSKTEKHREKKKETGKKKQNRISLTVGEL